MDNPIPVPPIGETFKGCCTEFVIAARLLPNSSDASARHGLTVKRMSVRQHYMVSKEIAAMDDKQAFLELSTMLTGLDHAFHSSAEDRLFNYRTLTEYAIRLRCTFPVKFPALLEAYKAVGDVLPKPTVDDVLLEKLKATKAFSDNEIVAKQIVNIWYFSEFSDEAGAASGALIDGGFYERGAVWTVVKAHPIGFSTLLHGYWTREPGKETL